MTDSILGDYEQQLVKEGAKLVHNDILMVIVMEKMGRSYDEYMNTPQRIIDLVVGKFNIDDRHGQTS